MPSKTPINWLFNDIWCYLFIACSNFKIDVCQQAAVRVYYILQWLRAKMFPGSFYSSGCCKEHLSNDSWFRSFSICVISKDFLFFVSSHYLETQWHLSSFVWHIFLFGTWTKIGQADHRYENEESLNCSFLLNFSDVLIESKIFCDVICEGEKLNISQLLNA